MTKTIAVAFGVLATKLKFWLPGLYTRKSMGCLITLSSFLVDVKSNKPFFFFFAESYQMLYT